jgi:hypothetical protein
MTAAYRRRNIRPVSEAPGVAVRLAAPGLAALALASWLAGGRGLASLVLLAAIVAASVRLLLAVGDAAEGRSHRFPVATSIAGLVCLVAAGGARLPLLVLGLLACSALELLAAPAPQPQVIAETAESIEPRISRAA